jgi:FkbM family methyltransferase
VGLYEQDPEVHLLGALSRRLGARVMLDIGAERGALAEAMLGAGIAELHAIEPHRDNASALRSRFANDHRLTVHECAASDGDGRGQLHVSRDANGELLSFGHTFLARSDTDEISWTETVEVPRRSLASMVQTRELPAAATIVKIDTEGHDLSVVRGMGDLVCDVVMVEHWQDLPLSLGVCPWSLEAMTEELRGRGFSHFVFIAHRGEFVSLEWDGARVERGDMGNLVFVHERVLELVMPDLLACASRLAERSVRLGQMYMTAAAERLTLIDGLHAAADAQQRAFDATVASADMYVKAANDRLALIEELQATVQAQQSALEASEASAQTYLDAANERLALVEALHAAARGQQRELEASQADAQTYADAANERLRLVNELHATAQEQQRALNARR